MQSKQYWPTGDIIRVLGTLGVVFIHITELLIVESKHFDAQWWLLIIIRSLSIWAVPGFIMLSGCLLLSPSAKEESSAHFYQKRLGRVGIPFLFWAGIYIPFQHWHNSDSFAHLISIAFGQGHISSHLFFLFAISGLYVLTPLLRHWLKQCSQKQCLMICIAIFMLTGVSELVREFLFLWHWNALTQWVPYLGYYLFGYYLMTYALGQINLLLIMFGVGVLMMSGGQYIELFVYPNASGYIYSTNYASVMMFLLSIGVLGLIGSLGRSLTPEAKLVQICRFFAPATFGIYLVHPLFVKGMRKLIGTTFPNNFATALLDEVGIIILSLLLVYAIGAIPVLRSVVSFNTQKQFQTLAPQQNS